MNKSKIEEALQIMLDECGHGEAQYDSEMWHVITLLEEGLGKRKPNKQIKPT